MSLSEPPKIELLIADDDADFRGMRGGGFVAVDSMLKKLPAGLKPWSF